MTNYSADEYNIERKNRLGYGGAKKYVNNLLVGSSQNIRIDTKLLGIKNLVSFYNSCYQAARRTGQCKVSRSGSAIYIEKIG